MLLVLGEQRFQAARPRRSPVTAEGVISRVTPFPLDDLMVVSSNVHSVPSAVGVQSGLDVPVLESSVQTVGSTAASKLPLLWAKVARAASSAMAAAPIITILVMRSPFTYDSTATHALGYVFQRRGGARMRSMKLRCRRAIASSRTAC